LNPARLAELSLQERLTECCAPVGLTEVPAPLKVCDANEPVTFVANERFALAAPVLFGENFTVNEILCPAFKVRGRVRPVTVNSELVVVMDLTTDEDPFAVRVAVLFRLDPTATLPKLRLAGAAETEPAPVPVPATGMLTRPDFPQATTSVPEYFVPDVGLNVTPSVTLSPGSRVSGSVGLLTVKPLPERLADARAIECWPTLVNTSRSVVVLPT
jgi:hypothetical protein